MSPTTQQFTQYQKLYDYYNEHLFENKLPFCLLNLSRNTARVCGHFSRNRWKGKDGTPTHEINLNPVYMARADDMDICQTLVHEMVHLWQDEFGKPSRTGYHNKEWANKMEEVGLTPSHTGKPGGKRTGQRMNDYATPDGIFLKVYKSMPKELLLPFKSREYVGGKAFQGGAVVTISFNGAADAVVKPSKKNKVKYTCSCGYNVWGKPKLHIICGECKTAFKP